jgi:hypothetical protein
MKTHTRKLLFSLALGLSFSASCAGPAFRAATASGWHTLFDGQSLEGWESIEYGGEGEITLGESCALLPRGAALTGVRYPAGLPMTSEYELEVRATRIMGNDFFCGLTIPIGDEFATVILGGWGGGLCGISCIDGADASLNETKSLRSFKRGEEYSLIVRVETGRIRAWVDHGLLFDLDSRESELSLRAEVLPSAPLGVSAYITTAEIGLVRWRSLADN